MKNVKRNTGFAIALAWPETWCKQPGSWYDNITGWLGFNKNNYYQAGHAALVLIESKTKTAHYFDFGRYHAPFQFGRVRSAETDQDLKLKTIPEISEDGKRIINYQQILNELQRNEACHGDGTLHASYTQIDFTTAYHTALRMQRKSPIPYGPFKTGGSNCSRFVKTVIAAGNPSWWSKFLLSYRVPLTPTPMSNIFSFNNRKSIPPVADHHPFYPIHPISKSTLSGTLPAPNRDRSIPDEAQWLGGEGVGSWFAFEFSGPFLLSRRYSTTGTIECEGYFKPVHESGFDPSGHFQIAYPSNCRIITITDGKQLFSFEWSHPISKAAHATG